MENESRAKELMKPVLKTEHYWCEDTFYACAAHIEYGGIDESGECDCGIDEYNAKIIKAIASLITAEQEKVVEVVRKKFSDTKKHEGSPDAELHGEEIKVFLNIVGNDVLTALDAHFEPPKECDVCGKELYPENWARIPNEPNPAYCHGHKPTCEECNDTGEITVGAHSVGNVGAMGSELHELEKEPCSCPKGEGDKSLKS